MVKIISEIACNHKGDLQIAKEMISESKKCGADYVKFQKRDLNSMSDEVKNRPYAGAHSFGATYGEHRKALEFSNEQWHELYDYSKNIGIGFIATPFDIPSLKFLVEKIGLEIVKYGSTQIHDEAMIQEWEHALYGVNLILSTGMSTLLEVDSAVKRLNPTVLMQTTSCYPCSENDVRLLVLKTYHDIYGCQLGLSGHYTSGNGAIEAAAVALGATWIERHFTLDRTWKGTDQAASLEPEGLKTVVKAVRTVERAMGNYYKKILDCEIPTLKKVKNV